MNRNETTGFIPDNFWIELGKTVAYFGWPEDILKRLIVELPGIGITKEELWEKNEADLQKEREKIYKMMASSLYHLIKKLKGMLKMLEDDSCAGLIKRLNQVKDERYMLFHGMWYERESGKSFCVKFGYLKENQLVYEKSTYNIEKIRKTKDEIINITHSYIELGRKYNISFGGPR